MESDIGFQAALEEAKQGAAEGGVPIGACLVSADGEILGRGHNMRIQKGSATLHVRRFSGYTCLCWSIQATSFLLGGSDLFVSLKSRLLVAL